MREINIDVHLPRVVPDDFQQSRPMQYAKSTEARFKMLRKSWAV